MIGIIKTAVISIAFALVLLMGMACGSEVSQPNVPGVTDQPTATPQPMPTATLQPIATPQPTATATPRPTATLQPTATATPRPTATATPNPIATPRPTATTAPRPTATSRPSPTPTRLPTPLPTRPAESYEFQNCTALREVFPNGVPLGHPAYQPKMDRDKDDWACERS